MSQLETFDDSHGITLAAIGAGVGVSNRVLTPGEIIGGDYQLKSLLGRGGMGYVFCAEHTIIKREYALKILAPEILNEASRRRFEIEGKAIANLDHANIVRVYNMGLDVGDCPFYVMDLLDGTALSDCKKGNIDLSFGQCLNIVGQIAAGLGYAHSKGIVHRDVKPSNIILIANNKGGYDVKIVDFGIAKLLPSNQHSQSYTAPGEVFGSPLYMSPEQCLGEAVDNRSDIYSLGCTMFEILTGRPPFRGHNAMATVMMHQSEPTPSILAARPDKEWPQSIDFLLEKMMAKRPQDRYQSMEHFIHDLGRIKQGKSIGKTSATATGFGMQTLDQTTPSTGERLGAPDRPEDKHAQRRRGLVPLLALAVFTIVGGGAAFWISLSTRPLHSKGQDQSAKQPGPRTTRGKTSEDLLFNPMGADGALNGSSADAVEQQMVHMGVSADEDKPAEVSPIAREKFRTAHRIRSVFVKDHGVTRKKFVFPGWSIGQISGRGLKPQEAEGTVYVPAGKMLLLEIGLSKSHEVFFNPSVVGLIDPGEFTELGIFGDSVAAPGTRHTSIEIEKSGVEQILKIASTWAGLEFINLRNVCLSPEILARLNQCTNLRRLELRGDMADTPTLVKQEFLQRLTSLVLDNTGNSNEICAALATSPNLKTIQVCDSNFTAQGLLELRHCVQLRQLVLRNLNADALLPVIGKLTQIEDIQFDSVDLSPRDLRAVIVIPNIQHIYLSRGDFSADSLKLPEFSNSKIVLQD